MEDRETARMRKYGESKTTRIMMATVPHVTSGFGLRKFQADGFLLTRVYMKVQMGFKWLRNCIYVPQFIARKHAAGVEVKLNISSLRVTEQVSYP